MIERKRVSTNRKMKGTDFLSRSIREGPREAHLEREGGTTDNKRKIDSEEDERNRRVFGAPLFHKGASMMLKCLYKCI